MFTFASLPADRFFDPWRGRLVADRRNDAAPRQVPGAHGSRIQPTPVSSPHLLAWSPVLGEQLGLQRPTALVGTTVQLLAGNTTLPGIEPWAARYGGHQFGQWAGQLGDGRALSLGALRCSKGQPWELQLKGAGRTAYSRTADGRAVLRSSLREFICSEAMHHLGIPTTRALSLVGTGDAVVRDMFYDGRPQAEPGAVVCRVAPSFVRFGNFEVHAALGEHDLLLQLLDVVIGDHFPECAKLADPIDRIAQWFEAICRRTGELIAHWMRVGFVHGVMNTDNMSALGLTIDYGPYGWLEGFDPLWTPNTTDASGRRYCYGRQPDIGLWNLERLADALSVLNVPDELLEAGLRTYAASYETTARQFLADKLGWRWIRDEDGRWLGDFYALLQAHETDFSVLFRSLARVDIVAPRGEEIVGAFYGAQKDWPADLMVRWQQLLNRYAARVRQDLRDHPPWAEERIVVMNRANPKYVFRNYLAQQCIDALQEGNSAPTERLLKVLERPYDEQPENIDLAAKRPEWARQKAGCSMLSCSS